MVKAIKCKEQVIRLFQQWYFLDDILKGQLKSVSITVHCNKPGQVFPEQCNYTITRTQHDTSITIPCSYGFLYEILSFQFQPIFNALFHRRHDIHCLTSQHLCRMYNYYLWISVSTCGNINSFIFHYQSITGAINQDCCEFIGTDTINTFFSFNLCSSFGKLSSPIIICVGYSNVGILFHVHM